MTKLSVVIMAFNEEKRIASCLQSIKDLANEIIVVDNTSTDTTVAIAKQYTDNIYSQKNDPLNIDIQKNFGFSKANGEWILSLDPDERVTEALAEEVKEHLASDVQRSVNGYWIPRKNIIFGKWIEHTGWYPDYQLRLFRNGKGKYVGTHVHEDLQIEGKTAKLKHVLLHQHYEAVYQFIFHNLHYIQNEAETRLQKGYTFNYLDVVRFPFQEFLSRFFAREGYKDGLHGLVLSLLMSWYHFMVFLYIWEKKKFVVVGAQDMHTGRQEFLPQLEREANKNYKELLYWFYNEKIKNARNSFEEYMLKIKRKVL